MGQSWENITVSQWLGSQMMSSNNSQWGNKGVGTLSVNGYRFVHERRVTVYHKHTIFQSAMHGISICNIQGGGVQNICTPKSKKTWKAKSCLGVRVRTPLVLPCTKPTLFAPARKNTIGTLGLQQHQPNLRWEVMWASLHNPTCVWQTTTWFSSRKIFACCGKVILISKTAVSNCILRTTNCLRHEEWSNIEMGLCRKIHWSFRRCCLHATNSSLQFSAREREQLSRRAEKFGVHTKKARKQFTCCSFLRSKHTNTKARNGRVWMHVACPKSWTSQGGFDPGADPTVHNGFESLNSRARLTSVSCQRVPVSEARPFPCRNLKALQSFPNWSGHAIEKLLKSWTPVGKCRKWNIPWCQGRPPTCYQKGRLCVSSPLLVSFSEDVWWK